LVPLPRCTSTVPASRQTSVPPLFESSMTSFPPPAINAYRDGTAGLTRPFDSVIAAVQM